jgi:protein translocase SEC61 complex gamma subunit
MGLGKALQSTWRTLKLTRKSDREEFMLYLKLVMLGFGVVGAIGFVIYFIAAMLVLVVSGHVVNPTGQTTPAILFGLLLG